MQVLLASELLAVWEQGLSQGPLQRALTLLAAACPGINVDTLANLSIGQRDARLLTLREWTFGPQLVCLAICPQCGEQLEAACNVDDIRAGTEIETSEPLSLSIAEHEVRFRLPNSVDLLSVANIEDLAGSRQLLFERCLLAAGYHGEDRSAEQLPAHVVEAIIDHMAQVDPQADVELSLCCPGCNHDWLATFDIISFFWSEINAWAYRILREVHVLASAYGWRESDILAMSAQRRQIYLELVEA